MRQTMPGANMGYSSRESFVYDPDQDADEKRAVHKDYRSLTKNMEEYQSNLASLSIEQIEKDVSKADKLFNKVKGPQEATLDSAFLLMASNLGAQKAQAMKSGTGAFDIDEFVSNLITFMGGRKFRDQIPDDDSEIDAAEDDPDSVLDWGRIGQKALAKSHRVPALSFMLGPLSIEVKKHAIVNHTRLEKNKDEQCKPQELKEEDIGPINLFRFIINPHDFAQSVENIFHLLFLIRDGKVTLDTEADGEPTIYLCMQPSDEDYENGLRKHQIVLGFDEATWKGVIEVFDIKEPTIPQRAATRTQLGDEWYG
ncbi:hypothetical protein ARMGADRAFT_1136844 [Armillaria gallica]|uniref:Non-structural maintenance of chromosomes element 4 n=1 Tax=Armillaria gallica TaxID=47427 RepID=A0A2H3D7W5_ARMGA|nr:hypothetical protein ARMGADRAFT_1136844 [Armillaria gallica]